MTTNSELAELRGEIVGLKVLITNCLAFNAALTDDSTAYLDSIQHESLVGMQKITDERVRDAHLALYRGAAAGLVLQLVEHAKALHIPVAPRQPLQ